jgi:AcrR family transcriptional regulator
LEQVYRECVARPRYGVEMDFARQIDAVIPELAGNARRDLLIAGLELFWEFGYHGTSTRAIGKKAGVSDAALYVHYPSKSALLYEIALAGHRSILTTVTEALDNAPDGPRARVLAFMRAFTAWHAEHAGLARVVQYELRAVEEPHLPAIVGMRTRFESLLKTELRAGQKQQEFRLESIESTSRALLSMGIDVARWYGIPRTPQPAKLGEEYATLCDRMLGPRVEAARA